MNNQVFSDYKFVVALNEKCDIGVVLNAASHACLGLMAQASEEDRKKWFTCLQLYISQDRL